MIDVSVLIELTDPEVGGREPGTALMFGGMLLVFVGLPGSLLTLSGLLPRRSTTTGAPATVSTPPPYPRWAQALACVALLAVGGAGILTYWKGAAAHEAYTAAHERDVDDYEKAVAARERETKRAERAITAAIEDQYKVEEARTGWGRTDDWQSARKALSASKMDAPRVTVVTEDNRRGFVLVEYDNASGEVALLSDTSDRQQGSKGIDVTGLRR